MMNQKLLKAKLLCMMMLALTACNDDDDNNGTPTVERKNQNINILAFNDFHGNLEPPKRFIEAEDPTDNTKNVRIPVGGVSYFADAIKKLRAQYPNNAVVSAGDLISASPLTSSLFLDEPTIEAMNDIQIDFNAVGNHEFDGGINGLNKAMQQLRFPLLNCNYDFTASDLDGKIFPYDIVQKGSIKIGIIAVGIRLKGLVADEMCKGIVYHDPADVADQLAKELKQKGCHIIVCLSHLGLEYKNKEYLDDITFAAKTKHIDVIIGGHTHSFMDEPLIIQNLANRNVIIHQVGWAGLRLGVLRMKINTKTGEIMI